VFKNIVMHSQNVILAQRFTNVTINHAYKILSFVLQEKLVQTQAKSFVLIILALITNYNVEIQHNVLLEKSDVQTALALITIL
jgi:hypothetical protein